MKTFPETPIPFDTDWHHQLGDRLSVFPRNLSFCGEALVLNYWPDLATFIEDADALHLAYYPAHYSAFSISVIFKKSNSTWSALKFNDTYLLQGSQGAKFEQVMAETLGWEFTPGEVQELKSLRDIDREG